MRSNAIILRTIQVKWTFLFICVASFSTHLFAYSDHVKIDTIRIPLIIINSPFFELEEQYLSPEDSIWTRTLPRYADAGIMLQSITPLYLRNYGPGLSYSISLRGGNSAQTAVLWNGININNPMQGQADLSLIKLAPGTSVKLQPNSYLHGLSGSVEISEKMRSSKGWKYNFSETLSSLISNETSFTLEGGKKGLRTKISFDLNKGKNEFSYYKNGIKKTSDHNASLFYQLKLQLEKQLTKRQKLSFHSWTYKSDRQIPASLYENMSDAIQLDESAKMIGGYTFNGNRWIIQAQAAWFYDVLKYESPIKNIYSNSSASRYIQKCKFGYSESSTGHFSLNLTNELTRVNSNAYDEKVGINELSADINYHKQWNNQHYLTAGLKTGVYDFEGSPLAPFALYRYSPGSRFRFMVSVGKKFRYPGLNDLFWSAGGNKNLNAEIAWESEGGLSINFKEQWEFECRSYYKQVKNWIQWLPNNGIFQASNIKNVTSKGIEISIRHEQKIGSTLISSRSFYNLNQTQKIEEGHENFQLIYTPKHLIKQNLQLNRKNWNLQLDQSWTGKIYTTTDNSASLNPFYLIDLGISKKITIKRQHISAWFKVANLFNKKYFTIQNYVMPGRVFRLGFTIEN